MRRMYRSDQSRHMAFQFKDPFAADQFVVANTALGIACRPNCDLGFPEYKKQHLRFYDSLDQAVADHFTPCKYCFPNGHANDHSGTSKHNSHAHAVVVPPGCVAIDIDLLVRTVQHVNSAIDFIPPLLVEDEAKTGVLRKMIWASSNGVLKRRPLPGAAFRTSPGHGSSDSNSLHPPSSPDSVSLTKNEFDRLKLIDLAFRHIAMAASTTIPELSSSPATSSSGGASHLGSVSSEAGQRAGDSAGKKRRRRGGVLGFKELAAKSNLSPWHFHRVFKGVTGLTPKNYGDRCCDFLRRQASSPPSDRVIAIAAHIANPTLADEESAEVGSTADENTVVTDTAAGDDLISSASMSLSNSLNTHTQSNMTPSSSALSSPTSAHSVLSCSPVTASFKAHSMARAESAGESSNKRRRHSKVDTEPKSPMEYFPYPSEPHFAQGPPDASFLSVGVPTLVSSTTPTYTSKGDSTEAELRAEWGSSSSSSSLTLMSHYCSQSPRFVHP